MNIFTFVCQVNLPTAMLIFLSQMVNRSTGKLKKKLKKIEREKKKNPCRFTEKYLDMVIEVNLTVMLVVATL